MVLIAKKRLIDLDILEVPGYLCALIAIIIAIIFVLFVFEII